MTGRGRPVPRVAFWLSAAVPGLGQVYAGAPLRGLLFFTLAATGAWVVADGLAWGYVRPHPEGLVYLSIGVVLLGASWPASAFHARRHAASLDQWPALYRFGPDFLARPAVQRALQVAPVEIAMAASFAFLIVLYLADVALPDWLRELPRFWFLYEAGVALYLGLSHGLLAALEVRHRGRLTAQMARRRTAGFLLIAAAIAVLLRFAAGVPAAHLATGFLIALPSCWYTLRRRSGELAELHMERFARCMLLGLATLLVLAVFVNALRLATGVPEYELRLRREADLVPALMGFLYYSFGAALEVWRGRAAVG